MYVHCVPGTTFHGLLVDFSSATSRSTKFSNATHGAQHTTTTTGSNQIVCVCDTISACRGCDASRWGWKKQKRGEKSCSLDYVVVAVSSACQGSFGRAPVDDSWLNLEEALPNVFIE